MSPAEAQMKKSILTLPLAKQRYKHETVLKTHKLFIYGDIHYITNSFYRDKNSDKLAKVVIRNFYKMFSIVISIS
jgi:hypothetical protein